MTTQGDPMSDLLRGLRERCECITVTETTFEVHHTHFREVNHAAWAALIKWIQFHDIDSHVIPLLSEIVRNVEACRVEYEQFVFGADGTPTFDNHDAVTRPAHSQGEAPPLPWPPELQAFRTDESETP